MPVFPALATVKKYERPLSALMMVAGFVFDNYYFGRVDHPATQIVLVAYLLIATAAIVALHAIESATEPGAFLQRLHAVLFALSQFVFGGLWSALLIFYWRSAVTSESWPFLLLLAAIFVGNEHFRKYRARLAFTASLLFFAIFSYTIFAVPILTLTIGRATFILSGLAALAWFALVLYALRVVGPTRFRESERGIVAGSALVYAALNGFYFTNILPPLPLALSDAGVYHTVAKTGDVYRAITEPEPWYETLIALPVMHVSPGGALSVYCAVFAPIALHADIMHVWQRYDAPAQTWRTVSTVAFPITGGRDNGYRAFSIKSNIGGGLWRVNVATAGGQLIGRVAFTVEVSPTPPATVTKILE